MFRALLGKWSEATEEKQSTMGDETAILLKLYEIQFGYLQKTEDHRLQSTNIVLVIASALIGFIGQKGLTYDVLPVTVLLIALGIYGAVVAEKFYERFWFWRERAQALERKLNQLHPNTEVTRLFKEAEDLNTKNFPRLHKIRLHHLWVVLHYGIAAAGVILTLVIVFAPRA